MKIKFHSFDALRFLSFLVVFLSHLPYRRFPSSILDVFQTKGKIGVYFFFTLSGFLITYILLSEKINNKKILFKLFLWRRILRIWPLFYTMVFFSMLFSYIIQHYDLTSGLNIKYQPNWILTSLFLENYQNIYYNTFSHIPPLSLVWSLCVEEHFYVIWATTLLFCSIKQVPKMILTYTIISIVASHYFIINNLKQLDILTNLCFFMCGALPAYLVLVYKEKTEKIINNASTVFKILIFIITVLTIPFYRHINLGLFSCFENLLYGVLFGLVLLIFIPQEKNTFKISDQNILSKLGNYTYGLYLIHIIPIIGLEKIFMILNIDFKTYFILFILLCLLFTILGAYLSYNLIEKPFLKLKDKFKN